MYAIIETGGKQYRVSEGDVVYVEKLEAEVGGNVTFDKVILISNDGGVVAGTPFVAGATVTAKVDKQDRAKKILAYKYKAKKNYRRKQGHRQPYTKVTIEKING